MVLYVVIHSQCDTCSRSRSNQQEHRDRVMNCYGARHQKECVLTYFKNKSVKCMTYLEYFRCKKNFTLELEFLTLFLHTIHLHWEDADCVACVCVVVASVSCGELGHFFIINPYIYSISSDSLTVCLSSCHSCACA